MAFLTYIMDFSGIYSEEDFNPAGSVRLSFSDLDGTECYCDEAAAEVIRRRIKPYPAEALHWIDGGDYHYVTKFWLEKLRRPFDLILLDHHSDDQPSAFGGGLLSCGGWVADARRDLPLLRGSLWISQYPGPALQSGRPVYLSIDKDILSTEEARTNWDQGTMTLPQLEDILRTVAASRELLGIDVCGGLSLSKGACGKDVDINRRADEKLQAFLVSLRTI
jgi:hypothetical protein